MTDSYETNHAVKGVTYPLRRLCPSCSYEAIFSSSIFCRRLVQNSIIFLSAFASKLLMLAGWISSAPISVVTSIKIGLSGFWWYGKIVTRTRLSGKTSSFLMPGSNAFGSSWGRSTESSFHVGGTYMMDVASGGINAAAGISDFLKPKHTGVAA
ncbi:hypothetical protein [Acetobacter pasteurianus]|uniref:hypothetical protein n=1 Tax=Acetobacter pasteurianus TaxID=438 RepID=UPI000F566482|nr:hypothetical protein [Acetobacter pasteurianus]GCD50867.1 hypothetical protein NBRC106471_2423 [Acetobacter pasteurianus subsp. pasteurianus LMG 1262 = NBRC 106471]